MEKINIDSQKCKGCRLCVTVCPLDIIEMSDKRNEKGYCPAVVTDKDKCISCGRCAEICPDLAIKIYENV